MKKQTTFAHVENWEEVGKMEEFKSKNDGWKRIFSLYRP